MWQRCGMDAQSDMAHVEAIKLGNCYLDVGPDPDDAGQALIQVVPAQQAIVLLDPAQPSRRIAGLRTWVDDEATMERAIVYTPDDIVWYERDPNTQSRDWQVAEGTGKNTLGVVPLIPLANNPGLLDRQGRSDLANVIPLQDAVNKLVSDSDGSSARRSGSWATGDQVPGSTRRPVKKLRPFVVGSGPDDGHRENAQARRLDVTDLSELRSARRRSQHLARRRARRRT